MASRERLSKIFETSRTTRVLKEQPAADFAPVADDVKIIQSNSARRKVLDLDYQQCQLHEKLNGKRGIAVHGFSSKRNKENTSDGPLRNKQINGLPNDDEHEVDETVKKRTALDDFQARQPNHNSHLRRSTRNSGQPSRLQADSVDLDDSEPVQRYSMTVGLGPPWAKPLTYPKTGKKKVTVEWDDLERLDEGEFLNDNLISFYLRYLENELEVNRPDLAKRVYFFNSFFYERLTSVRAGQKGINYEGVQRWTRNVDLFTYDYIVVPINELSHWYLAIICNLPSLKRKLILSEEPEDRSTTTMDNKDLAYDDVSKEASPDAETMQSFADMSLENERRKRRASEAGLAEERSPTPLYEAPAPLIADDAEMLDGPNHVQHSPVETRIPVPNGQHNGETSQSPLEGTPTKLKAAARKKTKVRRLPPITSRDPDLPCIITFDSFGYARGSVVRILKQYLVEEAKAKRGGMELDEMQIKGITAKDIPQQRNFSDCGLFMLGYTEKFLSSEPRDFVSKIISRQFDVKNDWPRMDAAMMRSSIRDQLQSLHRDEQKAPKLPAQKLQQPSKVSGADQGSKEPPVNVNEQASLSAGRPLSTEVPYDSRLVEHAEKRHADANKLKQAVEDMAFATLKKVPSPSIAPMSAPVDEHEDSVAIVEGPALSSQLQEQILVSQSTDQPPSSQPVHTNTTSPQRVISPRKSMTVEIPDSRSQSFNHTLVGDDDDDDDDEVLVSPILQPPPLPERPELQLQQQQQELKTSGHGSESLIQGQSVLKQVSIPIPAKEIHSKEDKEEQLSAPPTPPNRRGKGRPLASVGSSMTRTNGMLKRGEVINLDD